MDKDEYPAWPPQRAARFGGRAEGAARREDPLGAAAPTRPAGFPPPPPVGAAGCDRYITGLSGPLPGARRVVPQRSFAPLSLCEAKALFCFCRRGFSSEASRFGTWLPGLPGPDPGHFFLGEKVTKTPPGTPRTPLFIQSDAPKLCECAATEVADSFGLLICGGFLVDASAVALLKGEMKLFFQRRTACNCRNCISFCRSMMEPIPGTRARRSG